jgi:hypothetical protein
MRLIAGGHISVQCTRTLTLQLENCATVKSSWALDTTSVEMYPSVLTTGDIVRIWVLWDVMPCDCKWFLLFWRFLSPSECWEPPMQRHSVNNLQDLNSHEHHCENVRYQVSWCCKSTCCLHCSGHTVYMQWMVLTYPQVDVDQCPFDFRVFTPFKNDQIWVRWSQKGGAVILAEASGFFSGGNPWTSVSMDCWSQLQWKYFEGYFLLCLEQSPNGCQLKKMSVWTIMICSPQNLL